MANAPASWRLLRSPPATGAWNMAVDEAILESTSRSLVPPTLRLYAWSPACLSLGYAQSIDDADIEIFYESNKDRIGYPLDMLRDQLREMLVQQKRQAKQAELIAETKRNQSFELALSKPIAPRVTIDTEGFPSKGNPGAKVTIVEFADYQCPHCKSSAAVIEQIVKRHNDDVRVVFMDFPVNRSGISRVVAEGAVCADKQGQFWPYHDLAFEQQQNLSNDSALRFARELGMDIDEFKACLESQLPRDRIAKSEGEASRLGVKSTPTLFLNGRQLHLHDLEAELSEAVEQAIGEKET